MTSININEFSLCEKYYNSSVIDKLLEVDTNASGYDSKNMMGITEQKKLKKLKKFMSKKTQSNTLIYKKTEYKDIPYGRYFVKSDKYNNAGYQNLQSTIRRLLMDGKYTSFDNVSCAPTILSQLCHKHDIDSSAIDSWIENREQHSNDICTKYNVVKKNAKQLINSLTHGGSFDEWSKLMELRSNTKPIEFIQSYTLNIQNIQKQAIKSFPEYSKALMIGKSKTKTDKEANRSAIALYIQEHESNIMMSMINFFNTKTNIKVASSIYDEVVVYNDDSINEKLKQSLSSFIEKQTSFKMKIKTELLEPNNDDIEWLKVHEPFQVQKDKRKIDQIHAENWLSLFKEQVYRTPMGLMMYDEESGVWTKDKSLHLSIAHKFHENIFCDGDGTETDGSFVTHFDKAYRIIEAIAPRLNFFDTYTPNKGYLLFDNGVLDMENMLLKEKHQDYHFVHKIHRNYDVSKDYSFLKKELISKLFENPFTSIEKIDYVLEMIARASAGVSMEDRTFMFLIGETSCGKGKLTQLLLSTFEEFADSFNGSHLTDTIDGENEKAWGWAVSLYNRRFSISNESKPPTNHGKNGFGEHQVSLNKINSNTMKTVCSNGDQIAMRSLYKDAFKVQFQAFIIGLMNDVPEVDNPSDNAYLDRARYVTYDRSSSDSITESNDEFFPKDSTIDDYVKRIDVMDAFVAICCEYYKNSIINGKKEVPECVKVAVQEMTGSTQSGIEWVRNRYEISENIDILKEYDGVQSDRSNIYRFNWDKVGDNYVLFDTLYSWYLKDGNAESKTKFGLLLNKHKLFAGIKKINGRAKVVRVGIKKPKQDDDDDHFFD